MARVEQIKHKAGSIVDGMVSNNVPLELCDNYYQGFIDGANWADNNPKEELVSIDKVCKWLQKYFVEDHYGMSPSGFCAFEYLLRKAMKL